VFFLRDPSEMVEKKWGHDPRRADLVQLLTLAEQNRAALHEEWERKVITRAPGLER
jgi:hypothetical protein